MKFDEIGYWSEIKLEIIKQHASKYSLIIENQSQLLFRTDKKDFRIGLRTSSGLPVTKKKLPPHTMCSGSTEHSTHR